MLARGVPPPTSTSSAVSDSRTPDPLTLARYSLITHRSGQLRSVLPPPSIGGAGGNTFPVSKGNQRLRVGARRMCVWPFCSNKLPRATFLLKYCSRPRTAAHLQNDGREATLLPARPYPIELFEPLVQIVSTRGIPTGPKISRCAFAQCDHAFRAVCR